jgi:GT2 family glycosyltransferase
MNYNRHIWIVTSTFDRFDSLATYFELLSIQTESNFTLVLVDHGNKRVEDYIQIPKFVKIIRSSPNKWWTGAMNDGIRYAITYSKSDKDVIILQCDDSLFYDNFISNLVNTIEKEDALVGAIALNEKNDKILHAQLKFQPLTGKYSYPLQGKELNTFGLKPKKSDVLKGRGVGCSINNLKKIGLLEEKLPHYKADHEWAHRANKKNINVLVAPNVIVKANLKTQLKIEKSKLFASLFRYIFHQRSTANIRDIIVYYFLCFPKYKAIYYSIVNATLIYAYVFLLTIKYSIESLRQNTQPNNE